MFVNRKKIEKQKRNLKKLVDTRGMSWYYIQALEKQGFARGSGGRGNLENDTEKERETTVNSEMSF
ncbi:MAG: hypothetical protein IJJ60_08300, partial [Clostridia bacterium]|nr:hypothetical protein [Clostridia bacterium]